MHGELLTLGMAQTWWEGPLPRRRRRRLDRPGLYVSAEPGYYHHGMFADLFDRKAADGPGFYDWAVRRHPTKPVMAAVGQRHDVDAEAAARRPALAA